jgi:hypothetical protein
MLQGRLIALCQGSDKEPVGGRPLPIDDHILVGQGQQGVSKHLKAIERDSSLELAVGQEVEVIEPTLESTWLIGVLIENRVVQA